MKVLVTGGLGFIGSAVSKYLLSLNHGVLIVDDGQDSVADGHFDASMVVRQSIGAISISAISQFSPDVAMHFAASGAVRRGETEPLLYLKNNLTEFGAFLKKLSDVGCKRIVYSGSSSVYGDREFSREGDFPTPTSWYAWTKLMGEELLARFAKTDGIKYLAFRYFNVAGAVPGIVEKRMHEEHLIPKLFDSIELGTPFTLFGTDWPTKDGTCVRDYIHVLDLAEAHLAGAKALVEGSVENEIVNLGTEKGYSTREVLETVQQITGRKVNRKDGPRQPGDDSYRIADCSKARRLLGWAPKRGLQEMISDAWASRVGLRER